MSVRGSFDERISEIRTEIIRMGNLSSEMIDLAVQAATTGNEDHAREVIVRDDLVDSLEEEVIRATVMLVMREAPVAGDLRTLTSTLGVIGEFEKVADDAVKLARRARKVRGFFPGELKSSLVEMAGQSRKLLASCVRLYTHYDAALASEIVDADDVVDKQYSIACQRIIELIRENPVHAEKYVATMEIFHALEHIADRCVSVAKRLRVHYESPMTGSRLG
jgi:phosphate transport system protein